MQKITLPFINVKTLIPMVSLHLEGDKTLYAVIDTGAEISLFDGSLKESFPNLFVSSKSLGKGVLNGLTWKSDKKPDVNKIQLSIMGEDDIIIPLKTSALEHDLKAMFQAMTDLEGFKDSILLLRDATCSKNTMGSST